MGSRKKVLPGDVLDERDDEVVLEREDAERGVEREGHRRRRVVGQHDLLRARLVVGAPAIERVPRQDIALLLIARRAVSLGEQGAVDQCLFEVEDERVLFPGAEGRQERRFSPHAFLSAVRRM